MLFSLEQLAHFDSCLFPDDIAEEIGKVANYNLTQIVLLKIELRTKAPLNVVGMFQDRIGDERFCNALKEVLTNFCKRYEDT